MKATVRTRLAQLLTIGFLASAIAPVALADDDDDETPFGAAVVIIELTEDDIELQVFADAFDWSRLRIYEGGLSEMAFASEPSHYLNNEDNYDEEVEDFLRRWPQGYYEFEGRRLGGLGELESEAYLSLVLAAIPEVTAPVEDAVVPYDEPLLIAWDPVTEQYTGEDGTLPTFGDGSATIIEYQVIVNQETPERAEPWIDGGTRRALINLPGDITEIVIPPEVLEPGATYEIEILAIEASGNSSIGVLAFETDD